MPSAFVLEHKFPLPLDIIVFDNLIFGLVAQLVAQETLNLLVVGSSPTKPRLNYKFCKYLFYLQHFYYFLVLIRMFIVIRKEKLFINRLNFMKSPAAIVGKNFTGKNNAHSAKLNDPADSVSFADSKKKNNKLGILLAALSAAGLMGCQTSGAEASMPQPPVSPNKLSGKTFDNNKEVKKSSVSENKTAEHKDVKKKTSQSAVLDSRKSNLSSNEIVVNLDDLNNASKIADMIDEYYAEEEIVVGDSLNSEEFKKYTPPAAETQIPDENDVVKYAPPEILDEDEGSNPIVTSLDGNEVL